MNIDHANRLRCFKKKDWSLLYNGTYSVRSQKTLFKRATCRIFTKIYGKGICIFTLSTLKYVRYMTWYTLKISHICCQRLAGNPPLLYRVSLVIAHQLQRQQQTPSKSTQSKGQRVTTKFDKHENPVQSGKDMGNKQPTFINQTQI